MMMNIKFHNHLTRFAIKCILMGATFIGGWSMIDNSGWLGIGLFIISGCVAYRAQKQFHKFINHSNQQNRAVTLLQRQLTSDK